MEILIFFLLLVFFFGTIFGFIALIKKEKFPENRKKYFLKKLDEIKKYNDFEKKILNYDKILDQVLKEKKYSGTLGEKMKKFGQNFLNQNEIWFAHKMRNQIAHEVNPKISEKDFLKAEKIFLREIKNMME
ncbi:hypothetical protein LR002_01975 [Candidatus Gracilibacteria bacterium]|nr:hypothetical protein [Candidatus Gracilibacteria bacterium]